MAAAIALRQRLDWIGMVFAVVLTFVIVFPLVVVGLWAFTEVWRYPAIIPQHFGLKFWFQTLARYDVWEALGTSLKLSFVVTALSVVICRGIL